MMTERKHHEILTDIRDRLSPKAHEFLSGSREIEEELIVLAIRKGIDAAVAEAEALAAQEITAEDKRMLGELCTRSDSGKHFTETHSAEWLDRMEAAGYITIDRPVHQATGIAYSQEYWTVQVAAEVAEWFDSDGELID